MRFFIVTQVAFRRQKLRDEQKPRGYAENPVGWDGLSNPYTSAMRGCKGRCEIFRSIITPGLDRQRICRAKLSCLYNSSISLILQMASSTVQVTGIP